MTHCYHRTALVLGLALMCALSVAHGVQAQASAPLATQMTIEPLPPVEEGKPIIIAAQLSLVGSDRSGALNNEAVELLVDGAFERRLRTDPTGKVTFRLQRELSPGTYSIQVVYRGSRTLLPSQSSTMLIVKPAVVVSLPVATMLTVEPVKPIEAGRPVIIAAQLGLVNSDRAGALDNEAIELVIDGVFERRLRTDPAGKVVFRLQRELLPGTYNIQIVYRGSRTLLPSEAPATLTILPPVADEAGLPAATTLTIQPLPPIEIGEPILIDAQLGLVNSDRVGALDNEVIELFVEGAHERRARTDPFGKVSFRLQRDLLPGTYDIQIEYPGSQALATSQATARLKVVAAKVEVQTVPPLPGMKFALAGQSFTSDDRGVARIAVDRPGVYPLTVENVDAPNPNVQLKFARWMDEAFTPSRVITVPLSKPLVVGFSVSHRVGQTFVDAVGDPIDPGRISALTLRNSQGTVLNLTDGSPRWLLASSIARRANGLEATQILYSVDSVMIDGSNVVNQAQQRFYTEPDAIWKIQVLLYSMRVSGRDALFGYPIGTGLRLEYPDGRVEISPFNSRANVNIDGLVRGIYRASVSGAPGLSPISPVAMSRDQDVRLLVISYVDLAFALGMAAALGIGLVALGRPRLFPAMYQQLRAVRRNGFARTRSAHLRPSAKLAVAPVGDSVDGGGSSAVTRRRLDHTLLLAFAFISIGGLAGGLGAMRASAIQSSNLPTPDNLQAAQVSTPARVTADVPTSISQLQPRQTAAPRATPSPSASPDPTQVLTISPTADVSTPITQTRPREAATPSDTSAASISANPTPVLTRPPTAQPSQFSALKIQRILQEGNRGNDVVNLQQRLRELGYFSFPENTGYFGPITQRAVTAFQFEQCLPETGVVNAEVIRALDRNRSACAEAHHKFEGVLR